MTSIVSCTAENKFNVMINNSKGKSVALLLVLQWQLLDVVFEMKIVSPMIIYIIYTFHIANMHNLVLMTAKL